MKGSGNGRGRRGTSVRRRRSSRAMGEETASMKETGTGDAGRMNWYTAH